MKKTFIVFLITVIFGSLTFTNVFADRGNHYGWRNKKNIIQLKKQVIQNTTSIRNIWNDITNIYNINNDQQKNINVNTENIKKNRIDIDLNKINIADNTKAISELEEGLTRKVLTQSGTLNRLNVYSNGVFAGTAMFKKFGVFNRHQVLFTPNENFENTILRKNGTFSGFNDFEDLTVLYFSDTKCNFESKVYKGLTTYEPLIGHISDVLASRAHGSGLSSYWQNFYRNLLNEKNQDFIIPLSKHQLVSIKPIYHQPYKLYYVDKDTPPSPNMDFYSVGVIGTFGHTLNGTTFYCIMDYANSFSEGARASGNTYYSRELTPNNVEITGIDGYPLQTPITFKEAIE